MQKRKRKKLLLFEMTFGPFYLLASLIISLSLIIFFYQIGIAVVVWSHTCASYFHFDDLVKLHFVEIVIREQRVSILRYAMHMLIHCKTDVVVAFSFFNSHGKYTFYYYLYVCVFLFFAFLLRFVYFSYYFTCVVFFFCHFCSFWML